MLRFLVISKPLNHDKFSITNYTNGTLLRCCYPACQQTVSGHSRCVNYSLNLSCFMELSRGITQWLTNSVNNPQQSVTGELLLLYGARRQDIGLGQEKWTSAGRRGKHEETAGNSGNGWQICDSNEISTTLGSIKPPSGASPPSPVVQGLRVAHPKAQSP